MGREEGLQNLCLQSFSHNFKNTVHNWHLKALCDIFVFYEVIQYESQKFYLQYLCKSFLEVFKNESCEPIRIRFLDT